MHKCLHSCLKQIPEARLPLPPQGVAEGLLIKQEHTGLIKHASPVREHPRTIIQRTKGLCIQGQISELIWVQRGLQGSGQEGADKQLQGEAESQWESSDMWFGTVLCWLPVDRVQSYLQPLKNRRRSQLTHLQGEPDRAQSNVAISPRWSSLHGGTVC